jgi:hypothetical protein
MPTKHDNTLRTKALCRNNSAQTHGAVTDYGNVLTAAYFSNHGSVMPSPHYVRQSEQRGHERIVFSHRENKQRALRIRNSNSLRLGPGHTGVAEERDVNARRVQPFMTENTCSIGTGERHDHHVTPFQSPHVRADRLDDTDRFMPHGPALFRWLHGAIRAQVATADGGTSDADHRVRSLKFSRAI